MAISDKNVRITITVSKEMCERLDLYSSKMGTNRSALCAILVGQGVMAYDKAYEVMDKMGSSILEERK